MLSYKRYLNKDFLNGQDPNYINKFYQTDDIFWTSSGRGSFEFILQSLDFMEGECVLVPAIIAHGIILPIRRKKIQYLLYKCDRNLVPDREDIFKKISLYRIKLIVIVHYFGFPQNVPDLFNELRERNIIILEDCAQAFLSKYDDGTPLGKKGDIALFSMTKFIPVPDGSFIIFNNSQFKPPTIFYHRSLLHFLSVGFHHLYLKLKKIQSEQSINVLNQSLNLISKGLYYFYYQFICFQKNPVRISEYSNKLIREYDFDKFRSRRKKNTLKIFNALQDSGADLIFTSFNDYCITGIPVRSHLRQKIIKQFKRYNIEILTYLKKWNFIPKDVEDRYIEEIKFQQSHFLIPCSENFTDDQIDFIINSFRKISNTTNV